MTIGKREQIVIGSVAVIIVIALLHFFIFSRSHDQLTEVIRTDQESRSKITAMSQTTDATLDNYTSLTQTYLNEVRQGIRLLKLEQPKFFLAVTDADVTAAMPPDIPPRSAGSRPLAGFRRSRRPEPHPAARCDD